MKKTHARNVQQNSILKTAMGLVALVSLSACLETTGLSKVDTSTVFQSYTLAYEEDAQGFNATAQFTVGGALGTSLELDSGSYIRIGGVDMGRESFFGTRYVRKWAAAPTSGNYTFEWQDKEGRVYTNPANYKAFQITQGLTTVSLTGPTLVGVAGVTQADGGDFRMRISQSNGNGSSYSSFMGRWKSAGVIEFIPYASSGTYLSQGSAKVNIALENRGQVKQGTSQGGSLSTEHVSKSYWVTIIQ